MNVAVQENQRTQIYRISKQYGISDRTTQRWSLPELSSRQSNNYKMHQAVTMSLFTGQEATFHLALG